MNPATVLDREAEARKGSKTKSVLHMELRTGSLLPVSTPWALGPPNETLVGGKWMEGCYEFVE